MKLAFIDRRRMQLSKLIALCKLYQPLQCIIPYYRDKSDPIKSESREPHQPHRLSKYLSLSRVVEVFFTAARGNCVSFFTASECMLKYQTIIMNDTLPASRVYLKWQCGPHNLDPINLSERLASFYIVKWCKMKRSRGPHF